VLDHDRAMLHPLYVLKNVIIPSNLYLKTTL